MNGLENFKDITTFIFDVDGVLTDGTVLLMEHGIQARQMHVKDGLALQMAVKTGYQVVIISGSFSAPVKERLLYLGLQENYFSLENKLQFVQEYIEQRQINWNEVLYMGDDLPDVALLQQVGLPCCPADAVHEVKKVCHYISPVNGGFGCVRDVIEKVLKLNDHWYFDTGVTSK
ncbi:MAG: HAD hydrolase family protein [Chitinophagaceae bacterium]|nr:HAD hydrolase family protein [Chitinophagaceae bacterium]